MIAESWIVRGNLGNDGSGSAATSGDCTVPDVECTWLPAGPDRG